MNYLIIHDDTPIGRIVEPVADHSMGVVQGPFVPFQAYERVRAVFRLFAETQASGAQDTPEKLAHYHGELDALHLSVSTADGRLIPIIAAHVEDYSVELGEDGYEGFFVVEPNPLFAPSGSFFDDPRYWDGLPPSA